MSAPSPCHVMQTPQREFAGAKVLQKNDIRKYFYKKMHTPDNIQQNGHKKIEKHRR